MIRRLLLPALLLLAIGQLGQAAPEDAVVRQHSHGVSATVIYTEPGRSILLGCAHGYEGRDKKTGEPMRSKRPTLDVPSPAPGGPQAGNAKLLAIDTRLDLSLVELQAGPLPYVCPVAPRGHRPGRLLSVGYDEMKLPPQKRTATILRVEGTRTITREPPWHGRSGGALLDADAGLLIGVVHAYTGNRGAPDKGVYVSHAAVLSFLESNGWGPPDGQPQAPLPIVERPRQPAPQAAPRSDASPVISIPESLWEPNRTGIQCVWCSLKTIARAQGLTSCDDLTDRFKGTANPGHVRAALDARGVRYKQSTGNRSPEVLREPILAGRPVAIGLGGRHMVVMIGWKGSTALVIENSGRPRIREQSLAAWDGWAVVILDGTPPGARQQQQTPEPPVAPQVVPPIADQGPGPFAIPEPWTPEAAAPRSRPSQPSRPFSAEERIFGQQYFKPPHCTPGGG